MNPATRLQKTAVFVLRLLYVVIGDDGIVALVKNCTLEERGEILSRPPVTWEEGSTSGAIDSTRVMYVWRPGVTAVERCYVYTTFESWKDLFAVDHQKLRSWEGGQISWPSSMDPEVVDILRDGKVTLGQ